MNFNAFMTKVKDNVKEAAPEILIGAGILSVGAGIFFACKATLKVDAMKSELKKEMDEAVEYAKDKFEEIDEAVDNETLKGYDAQDAQQDKMTVYGQTAGTAIRTGLKVVKEYAPAAGFIVTGIALILFSHKILRDRNAALLTAYTALDSAFKVYRQRVIKDGGKELDAKYLYGTKEVTKEVKKVNPETGLEETVLETTEEIDYPLGSPYARIYDKEHAACYQNNDSNNYWNTSYLQAQQEAANEKLNRIGYVFLNDVYTMLGLTPTPEGQIVGWIKDNPDGDGYIDFGIDLCYTDPRFRNIIERNNGYLRRKLVLDFNVDGVIVDKIKWGIKGKNDLSPEELDEVYDQCEEAIANAGDPEYVALDNDSWARQNK